MYACYTQIIYRTYTLNISKYHPFTYTTLNVHVYTVIHYTASSLDPGLDCQQLPVILIAILV